MMILEVLGILAFGVGVVGVVYFLIKNEKEIRKNLEKEINEEMR